ncbi:UDP-3-O-(3-hydroxymyristoyl)glucosamine N-acyltransferase [Azovibrio restrictus]|uniref:UDP-3-O-(3-hydroxymyristoyl)glucosamine N-acyltransferase n=1 Tax=Azovibrio restrictus TaxID=146938 RepID=UPI0026E95C4D|nr:UDP-3-O-(3-hydroxymyristoyl)glucosamine N-acyltransferase [Azovibrio restrictus]
MHSDASGATYTLAAIVDRLGGELRGDGSLPITQVGTLQGATAGQITFLANPKYRKHLAETRASAVILVPELAGEVPGAAILTPKPYQYYARVAALLNPPVRAVAGIQPGAVCESTIPPSCHVGPGAHVGPGVVLGEGVEIRANAVIGAGVRIGAGSVVHPGAVIYPGCQVGERAIIHSGAVIGADGFGFARDTDGWLKIPQVGRVVLGNDVEIGANTSIDRGALEDTVIGDGCKLDNQIQIGHNCIIGAHTVIAGCVGIAGSTRIGHHCAIGGAAMILGHLEIAPGTEISPGTMVMKSIPRGGKYTALYPLDTHDRWLQNAAQLKHLDRLARRVAELERKLEELETKS